MNSQNKKARKIVADENAKKRAVVAVARKLAILLHRLWLSAEVYEPLYQARRTERDADVTVAA